MAANNAAAQHYANMASESAPAEQRWEAWHDFHGTGRITLNGDTLVYFQKAAPQSKPFGGKTAVDTIIRAVNNIQPLIDALDGLLACSELNESDMDEFTIQMIENAMAVINQAKTGAT